MADDPIDPTQLGPGAPPPDLGQDPTATPVLSGSPGSAAASGPPRPGRPALLDLVSEMIKPSMQASAPGQLARPVSRLDTFENFLGNFVYSLGQGMAHQGTGPGSFGRGFGGAISGSEQLAQQQYGQQQQAQAAQVQQQHEQAQTAQLQKQTELAGQMVTLPNGTTMPVTALGNYYKGAGAADIAAKGRMSVEQMKFRIMQGEVAKVLDYKDPQTGELGKMAYNKLGVPLGVIPGSLPSSSYLPKSTSTMEFKEDKDGNIVAIPKTSTSRPMIPGSAIGAPAKFAPPVGANAPKSAGASSRVPGAVAGRSTGVLGKSAGEAGYAFNPQTQETELTTRNEAATSGLQTFRKVGAKEIQDDTQLNNRLTDVATKLTRYEDMINTPISMGDKYAIAKILGEDKFKAGVSHIELPVDFLNIIDKARLAGNISSEAQKRLVSYYNARESMVGYQRVLSGGSKSSEKAMQLNLDALPNPIQPEDYGREAIKQFKENLSIAGQGLPKMPGITRAKDVLANADTVSVQIPGQQPGRVHKSQLAAFQKKYPSARVLQ